MRVRGLAYPRLSFASVLFFCLAFLLIGTRAAGQNNTWQGAANILDFWSNAGEWSLGVVPDGSTNIIIPQGGVLGDTSFTNLNVLTIGSPAELSLQSTTTVANVGLVVDNGTFSINSGATLSNNLGTFGGTGTYLNSGTIEGAGQIGSSTLGFPTLVNQAAGTINANVSGQALAINGVFTNNTGLMEATAGGTLSFTNGSIISNQGGIIDSNGGEVLLIGSTVQGGTLNNVSGTIAGISATLDGSTAAGAVTILGTFTGNSTSAPTFLLGTINNQGTIVGGEQLTLVGDTTLQGGGTVSLGGGAIDGTHVLTNVDNTIQGRGAIGDSFGGFPTLVNQAGGTINANVSSQTLTINGVFTNNTGLMEATAGGTLSFTNGSIISNQSGVIEADSGGQVNLFNSTVRGGTLNNVSGTIAGGFATNCGVE